MKKGLVFLFIFLIIWTLSYAEVSKEKIEKVLPGNIKIESLRFDEGYGLYEVISQGKIFYLTQDLRYLIIGNVIDLRTLRNITADRVREARKVNFDSLPKADAIKISDGKKAIAVFTDPDCPYCKKLHSELLKLKDTAIYIFLFPISEEGRKKSIRIWCSDDRLKALDLAFNSGNLRSEVCSEHPIDRNLFLGRKLFISGTPTIITDKGEFINGYVKLEVIQDALKR